MDETASSLATPSAASDVFTPAIPPPQDASRWKSALNLAEAGLLTDVGVIFDLASIYLPILGTAFIPLTPTPFAILYLRRGPRVTLLAAIVAGFLMSILTGPHYGWRLSLQALVGMAMGFAMRRKWRPIPAIALGALLVSVVAYGAAFGAIYALGLPLHDVYLTLQNALGSLTWLLHTIATLMGAQALWVQFAPWLATATTFTLRNWVAMFYVYVVALSLPTVILYYGVASSVAFALGHPVKPFPAPWVWRALRVGGLALTPVTWLIGMALRVVTAPLWGPVWLARQVARRRQRARLRKELAAIPPAASGPLGAADDMPEPEENGEMAASR